MITAIHDVPKNYRQTHKFAKDMFLYQNDNGEYICSIEGKDLFGRKYGKFLHIVN